MHRYRAVGRIDRDSADLFETDQSAILVDTGEPELLIAEPTEVEDE